LNVEDFQSLWEVLFLTYPFYIDRPSRDAVENCLCELLRGDHATEFLKFAVPAIKSEAEKGSLAPANYFILTEWACAILGELTNNLELWSKYSLILLHSLATSLEQTVSSARSTVSHSAIVVTRRVLRRVFNHDQIGEKAVPIFITKLSDKASSSNAKNAVLLGVVAGVCFRLPKRSASFSSHKNECLTFYSREFLGSRTRLPSHLVEGLKDLFENFVTLEDLQKEVVPAAEKALLRSPEVVLNDLIAPVINALPRSLDLSDILQKNLLKPLLSNIKSTNAEIRQGAFRTFQSIAEKSTNNQTNEKTLAEILTPLKQNKVTVVEQKLIYAQMIGILKSSPTIATSVIGGLGLVALKEVNDTALEAEVNALSIHVKFALQNDLESKAYSDTFIKGLVDKRPSARRLWALNAGDIVWSLPKDSLKQPQVIAFIQAIFSKGVDSLRDVAVNPNTAAQTGLATTSYIFTTLSLDTLSQLKDDNGKDVVSYDTFLKAATICDGKPSYLVNHRVFTKLASPLDMKWAVRALLSVYKRSPTKLKPDFENAWSQAILFFLASPLVDYRVRQDIAKELSISYAERPEVIGALVVQGLWLWLKDFYNEEKDSVAVLAKCSSSRLNTALGCICLAPAQRTGLENRITETILEEQMLQLLVIARKELIPKVSWIDLCLKVNMDPGRLVNKNIEECMEQIKKTVQASFLVHRITSS
jgi:hypothetical protein